MAAEAHDPPTGGDASDTLRDSPVTGRVLVVDDSLMVRKIVGRTLEQEGLRVRLAADVVTALDAIREDRFDVVVSDLCMPGLDGFDLLETLRGTPDPPEVIFLSGARADDFGAAVRALRLGAHDFLTKPPRHEELLHSVARAIETRRLREENRRLIQELERETRTDPLTQAGNRRAFAEALRTEMSRTRRYGTPLALAVLDLDRFKVTNDTWGHAAGDEVLRVFVARARGLLRDGDALFRLGGEEFAILFPCTDLGGAAAAAERVLDALRSSPVPFGEERVPVTASAGITCLDAGDEGADDLLARADAALYIAKNDGRDRASVADPAAARIESRPERTPTSDGEGRP